jgi:DNA polymerase-3 subunit beta
MRIDSPVGALADALGRAGLVLEKRTIPILTAITLRVDTADVWVAAANFEQCITATVQAEVESGGVIAVPGKRLLDLIAGFPDDATVSLTAHPSHVEIHSGASTYRLPRLAEQEVPDPLSAGDGARRVELTRDRALRLFERVAFAVAEKDPRYYYCGVHLHAVDGRLAAAAADGKTLARVVLDIPLPADAASIIVPNAGVALIIKLLKQLPRAHAPVSLAWSERVVEVVTANFSIASKLVDGTFPDYRRIIPTASSNFVVVARTDLKAVLARLEAVVDPQFKIPGVVGLEWEERTALHLSLQRQCGDADDPIAGEVTGQGKVALTLKALTNITNALVGERVRINHAGRTDPIVVTDPDDADLVVVTMPVLWNIAAQRHELHPARLRREPRRVSPKSATGDLR